MLAYFPPFYEDEVLYSAIARYHRHILSRSWRQTRSDLFGDVKSVAIPVDLPSGLDIFGQRLAHLITQSPQELVWQRTLLPFYTAFLPKQRQAELAEEMCKPATGVGRGGLYHSLGLGAQRTPYPRFLRTCTRCLGEDKKSHGETYWRRAHQLQGVHFCVKHAEPLVETDMPMRISVQSGIHAAHFDMKTASYLPSFSAEEQAILFQLSTMAVSLLDRPIFGSHEWSGIDYRGRIVEAGFKNDGIDYLSFSKELLKFCGESVLEFLIGVRNVNDVAYWVRYFCGGVSKTNSPVRHLIINKFFNSYVVREKKNRVISPGPWLCKNVAADHFGEPTIHSYKPVKNGKAGLRIGRFDCSCGFGFTGVLDDADECGQPAVSRVMCLGDSLESKLIQLLDDGYSHPEISAMLHISGLRVQRFASRRKTHPPVVVHSWGDEASSSDGTMSRIDGRKRPSSIRRVDWHLRDATLSEMLRGEAQRLSAIVPPKRVSSPALVRAVGFNSICTYIDMGLLPRTK